MTDLIFALAAFAAWTGIAGAVGYVARVRLERYRDRQRFDRIWASIKPEIEKLEQRKAEARRQQAEAALRRKNGRLQA